MMIMFCVSVDLLNWNGGGGADKSQFVGVYDDAGRVGPQLKTNLM